MRGDYLTSISPEEDADRIHAPSSRYHSPAKAGHRLLHGVRGARLRGGEREGVQCCGQDTFAAPRRQTTAEEGGMLCHAGLRGLLAGQMEVE